MSEKSPIEQINERVMADVRGAYERLIPGAEFRRAAGGFRTRCPLHDDSTPSFHIYARDGKWKCYGCNERGDFTDLTRLVRGLPDVQAAIAEAAGALGLPAPRHAPPARPAAQRGGPDPAEPAGHGRTEDQVLTEQRYEIISPDTHEPVAVHIRTNHADGKKTFRWEQPNGATGLAGVPCSSLPLYNQAWTLLLEEDVPIYVCEGEKAADALYDAGFAAVATVTGASSCPDPEVLARFAGRRMVVWPDNDEPGKGHMARVAKHLYRNGANVQVVSFAPQFEPGADAFEWVQSLTEAGLAQVRSLSPYADPSECGGVLLTDYDPEVHGQMSRCSA